MAPVTTANASFDLFTISEDHQALREAAVSLSEERWDSRAEAIFKFNTWAHYQEHIEAQANRI